MKPFAINLLLSLVVAAPAFASQAKHAKENESKTVQQKNLEDLSKILALSKGDASLNRYRVNGMDALDNEFTGGELNAGVRIGNWKVGPTAGSDRRWIMTPEEKRIEDQTISDVMPQGSKGLTHTGSEWRPTFYGIKLTRLFGARQ